MYILNKAGQTWFFNNVVVPYLSPNILKNWDDVKHAWFEDLEDCAMNTFAGDDIIYEINKQFTLDKQSFTLRMHTNVIDKHFDQRAVNESV